MNNSLSLTDILEKEEAENVYKRELSENEWENICFNLTTKFWSKVRAEMIDSLDDSPDYFLKDS